MMLYQTIDLFSLVLDHVSLVGVDVAKLIHQQLYHDTVLPLLTSLPSLVNIIGYLLGNPCVISVAIATMPHTV